MDFNIKCTADKKKKKWEKMNEMKELFVAWAGHDWVQKKI